MRRLARLVASFLVSRRTLLLEIEELHEENQRLRSELRRGVLSGFEIARRS